MNMTGSPATPFQMEVRLKSVKDMFNSLDPSPLIERDLDTRVEEFITAWAEEAPQDAPLHLVLHLPPGSVLMPEDETLQDAVQTYFRMSEARTRRKMKKLLAEGRRSALIGIVFLVACTTVSQLVRTIASGTIAETIGEGLLIIGWVANWRPVSILLYEWRPIRKELGTLSRLSHLTVQIQTEDARSLPVASA
ncbi:MAG: hypothetical protein R3B98_07610 [Hyphomonas sp.]